VCIDAVREQRKDISISSWNWLEDEKAFRGGNAELS
jgi:hypothetical protein